MTMLCPQCGGGPVRVVCTEHRDNKIRRFKACTVCEHRFRTTEVIDDEGKLYPLQPNACPIKLTAQKVSELRKLHRDEGLSYHQLAKKYDITVRHAEQICKRNRWKHVL